MTQPLEENRLYSSWSRTPGKPSSSSNFINTKISNISSSTDSGVGRTPNWNSDSENKFALYDSNLWSNSNTLSSSDIIDNSKRPLWDDNSNKNGNNFTFGFSSQWPTNTDIPWGMTRNNSADFVVSNDQSNKMDISWNNSQSIDLSNERFINRNISIWAANQAESSSNSTSTTANNMDNNNSSINNCQFQQIVDPNCKLSSKIISKSIQIQSESVDKSEFSLFSAFNNTAVNDIGNTDNDDINNSEPNSNSDKNIEHQTWAQAAGKGLQTNVKAEDCVKHEVDEQFLSLINRIDGWGSHTVDQSTPWVFENEICSSDSTEMKIGSLSSSSQSGQRNSGNRSAVESNVWTNEPPNGVGVWESHYENIGERTSRWGGSGGTAAATSSTLVGAVNTCQKSKSSTTGWDIGPMTDVINNQWTDRDDNSVWSSNTNPTIQNNSQQKPNWGGMMSNISKQDQAASSTPIGSGNRNNNSSSNTGGGNCTNSNIILSTQQRNSNSNSQPPVIVGGSGGGNGSLVIPTGDMNDQTNNRHSYYQNHQNVAMMPNNNRLVASNKSKQIMNIGFRKDDSQSNMFNNSLEINRPFMDMKNPSQLNHSNMLGSRSDWNMPHDNFRVNPTEPDNGVMLGSGYLPQSMITTNNNQSMKPHMLQHMQQMSMGNRLPSDNHLLLEKQIITEITQLQTKQQDLLQRIHGLRSIAGSQAFIQEMTRTLNEVRQQLNTQQTTLKVIRSQMSMVNNQMPNGIMNNNSNNNLLPLVSRTIQPSASGVQSQSQSGLVSDLSAQMNELKLQKRMDLWSQGNLPSPNAISSYMGADKPSGFYNPSIPNGGPMPPQSFNNFNRNSQFNCIPTHRTPPNQMWQSRMMQNSNSAATSSSANAFNAGTDSHSIINGPNIINDEMDSISNNNGLNNSNNSTNSKLQITSNCASDSTGNNNNNNNSTANSAITTALSLSQTLPSSIGSRVSSAFSSSRDISHISANISEFVPGQPWPGISYSQRDDPNVTLGAGPRSLLSITNDHLEKLANSSVNSINGPNDVGSNSTVNRLPNNMNGVCSSANRTNMTYVLIRDLPSHINVEMLKNVLTPINFPGLLHMHPNLASRWVLLHFTSNEEALKAYKNLYNKVGVVELLPDQEVNQVIRGHRNNGIIDHPMF